MPEQEPVIPDETLQEIPEAVRAQFPEVAQVYEELAGEYFEVVEKKVSLEEENAELRSRIEELEAENERLRSQPVSEEAWDQMIEIAKSALRNRRSVERQKKIATEQQSQIDELKLAVEKAENTDPLTGLLNSRGLEQSYDKLVENKSRRRRDYEQSSILFLDLDKFKTVNDSIGHMVGDEVLKTVAARLRSRLRDNDIIGRKGGDEFVIILPFTSAEDSLSLAEELRSLVQDVRSIGDIVLPNEFGASIGISRINPNQSFVDSTAVANEALRTAKRKGRNQVILLDENFPESA